MPSNPTAVLLDVGGVFLLPDRSRIRQALDQVNHSVIEDEVIDRAHYNATRVFPMNLTGDEDLRRHWDRYLEVYAQSLQVPEDVIPEAIEHLRNEYVSGGLWTEIITGSVSGLGALVDTGIPVGVVSNSNGTIEQRLQSLEILQVGPGSGVEVRCVIDSGAVGIEKPDPRIFDFALERLGMPPDGIWYVGDTPAFDVVGARRAGMKPILMDPFAVNGDYAVTCVGSLAELARKVAAGKDG
jgi:putative hydrolase of the HAD superfamily